jgi:fumarate hydratase subunit alpha
MKKRKISEALVISTVKKLVLKASFEIEPEVEKLLRQALRRETSPDGKTALRIILENIAIARGKKIPICQDTGLSVFFVELGRELDLDFDLVAAVNQGLRQATKEGYLRRSVADHVTRVNTGDNTPAIVHVRLAPGRKLKINLIIKGGGAENKSLVRMMSPAEGIAGIKKTVLDAVKNAGGQACPPIIVGLGIGGDLEMSAILAKQALLRKTGQRSRDKDLARLEKELIADINKLGIGPSGLGGKITCLSVQAEKAAGHIASLALAVNLQCWAHRGAKAVV